MIQKILIIHKIIKVKFQLKKKKYLYWLKNIKINKLLTFPIFNYKNKIYRKSHIC